MSGGQGKAPLIRPESYGLFDKLLFAVFVLAVPPFVASNSDIFGDGDVSWHVAAGRSILDHGRIPTTDPFSFSMPGKAWVTARVARRNPLRVRLHCRRPRRTGRGGRTWR